MSQNVIRRREKVLLDDEVHSLLNTAQVAHFGTVSANGEPYVVPDLFVHRDGKVLCHTAVAGHFRSNVLATGCACFEISETGTVFPYGRFECDTSVSYGSVIDLLIEKHSEAYGRPRSSYPHLQETIGYTIAIPPSRDSTRSPHAQPPGETNA